MWLQLRELGKGKVSVGFGHLLTRGSEFWATGQLPARASGPLQSRGLLEGSGQGSWRLRWPLACCPKVWGKGKPEIRQEPMSLHEEGGKPPPGHEANSCPLALLRVTPVSAVLPRPEAQLRPPCYNPGWLQAGLLPPPSCPVLPALEGERARHTTWQPG